MKLLIFLITVSIYRPLMAQVNIHKIPDPKAVDAYKHYWNTFDEYERRRIISKKDSISLAWDQLRQEFHHSQRVLSDEQIAQLKEAARKYRSHLKSYPNSQNTPYVLLNLAQILNKVGQHYAEKDVNAGTQYRSEALEVLDEVIKKYRIFERKEEVLYLKATILASLSQKESAHKTWVALASIATNSVYGAHAYIALGDYYFRAEISQKSLSSYQKAVKIISKLNFADKDYELVRVQYRIAWAAYRSAELGTCITTVIDILRPGRVLRKVSVKNAIEQDAVELIGDALYENNDINYTKSILGQQVLRNFSSAIALRMLKRYLAARIDSRAAELGEHVVATFPRALHIPDILVILADIYRKSDRTELWLEALEKLALMLPKNSLWRYQYQHQYEAIRNMEQAALHATIALASHYYKIGMINGSVSSFAAASSYYQSLLQFNGNHPNANDWRLKQANSYYFSSNLGGAQKIYSELVNDHRVDRKTLQIASFQIILTLEKIWREEYGKSVEANRDPKNDPIVLQFVVDMEDVVDRFANKFPSSQFAIEALLKAGAVNRDMERMEQAAKYWQRVLISKPKPLERSLAIRGLVYSQVKTGNYNEVIKVVGRYLKLEDWKSMGHGLQNELEGILVAAVQEGSDELTAKGDMLTAAYLLRDLTQDFPHLQSNDTFNRDAAYLLAIGGEWRQALDLAHRCLGIKRYTHKADMAYLKARALEFQMRFPLAAKAYLYLGQTYPSHSRAKISLKRAYQLAKAEDDMVTAAKSLKILARQSKEQQKKWQYYRQSAETYAEIGKAEDALQVARQAKRFAKTIENRLEIRLLIAKQRFRLGEEVKALRELQAISRNAKQYREKIDKSVYEKTYSEANFLIAEEQKNIFVGFKIKERSGSIINNIREKTRYFEKLTEKYNRAIKGNDPQFTIRSRYEIASAAETLSYEINELVLMDKAISSTHGIKLKHQAERLQKFSRNLYSENLMEARRRPKVHYNNPWLKKSSIKLTGFVDTTKMESEYQNMYSMTSLMPYQWSL